METWPLRGSGAGNGDSDSDSDGDGDGAVASTESAEVHHLP